MNCALGKHSFKHNAKKEWPTTIRSCRVPKKCMKVWNI